MRPFAAERPVEYPDKPAPIRSRQGLSHLPPGPEGPSPLLTIKFIANTPKFLLNLYQTYGDQASFFLGGSSSLPSLVPRRSWM
jgi:hypothetical protein